MNKANFNVVGNNENQELVKGIAFVKSRRAPLNVAQVSVVPLSTKLKDIPVHVILNPKDVSGFGISKMSDFMPEDAQTISKSCIRAKSGTVIENSGMREEIDRALIKQFDLLPVARKMVMEELANGQQN